jgi:hypothetical protein
VNDNLRALTFAQLVVRYEAVLKDLEDFDARGTPLDDPVTSGQHRRLIEDGRWRLEDEMRLRPEYPAYEAAKEDRRQAANQAAAERRAQMDAEQQRKGAFGSVAAGLAAAIAILTLPCIGLQHEQAARFATYLFCIAVVTAVVLGRKYWRRS